MVFAANDNHTVVLRSDGAAVACGANAVGECDIPDLDEGMSYTQVSAGLTHTALLRSNGTVVACGDNEQWFWTMQHSSFECGHIIHSGFCRR